jgi:hypothetical protein
MYRLTDIHTYGRTDVMVTLVSSGLKHRSENHYCRQTYRQTDGRRDWHVNNTIWYLLVSATYINRTHHMCAYIHNALRLPVPHLRIHDS